MKNDEIKKMVREGYAKIAQTSSSCCTPVSTCCGSPNSDIVKEISKNIGYSEEDLDSIPEGANLGLGCGNPVALASIKKGDTVLDLGSGAGFDAFLAAKRVGRTGLVIGVDMTAEMISSARKNAEEGGYENVEFRLGEIEHLPVDKNSVDLIISNCVINLVPDKVRAFKEAFRVLKPGGKVMISDITLLTELPDIIINSIEAYIGCVAGAIKKQDYLEIMKNAGFQNIKILSEQVFPFDPLTINPTTRGLIKKENIPMERLKELINTILSIKVEATKPRTILSKSQEDENIDKLKVDIYVPLDECSCQWDQFMNGIFEVLTPYIKFIEHTTKSIRTKEALKLNIHGKCVLIDGKKRFTSSMLLKKKLPELLREKGLI